MGTVTQLYEGNYRDPVFALRRLADQIEQGHLGAVSCVGVVSLGYRVEVRGFGPNADDATLALLLHSGFMRLSQQIESNAVRSSSV